MGERVIRKWLVAHLNPTRRRFAASSSPSPLHSRELFLGKAARLFVEFVSFSVTDMAMASVDIMVRSFGPLDTPPQVTQLHEWPQAERSKMNGPGDTRRQTSARHWRLQLIG